jgi:hypothetical protein
MSIQFSELVKIAGFTILLTLLWAASVAFTYWDTHQRHIAGGKGFVWIALVALLPFVGVLAYIFYRIFTQILSAGGKETDRTTKRETALKPSSTKRNPLPTFIAPDLTKQTVVDPNQAKQANAEQQKITAKYLFRIISGTDQGKEFIVESLPAKIGRGVEAAIRLDEDIGVSRKHAEIYEQGGMLRIRDLESKHGTQVNGLRIEDNRLESGDQVQIGLTVLVVKAIEE